MQPNFTNDPSRLIWPSETSFQNIFEEEAPSNERLKMPPSEELNHTSTNSSRSHINPRKSSLKYNIINVSTLFLVILSVAQDLNLSSRKHRSQAISGVSGQFLSSGAPPPPPHLNNETTSYSSNNSSSSASQAASASAKADFLLNLVKTSFNPNPSSNPTTHNNSSIATSLSSSSSQAAANSGTSNRSLSPLLKQRSGQQREHYKTVYACEGKQLNLDCSDGKLIHLSRALYGRFSLSICNDNGNSSYSVQCFSVRAFLIMETKCNNLSNCSVTASKELFGDPCEGTEKYLEVQYYCHDVNAVNQPTQTIASKANNQQEPRLHQQQQKRPSQIETITNRFNNNQADTPSPPPLPNISHKSHPTSEIVGGGSSNEQQQTDPTADFGQQQSTSTVIQKQSSSLSFCSPQTSSRNLYWNLTRADQQARQACPEGAQGKVSWFCDASGSSGGLSGARFSPSWSPDFSGCRLIWLINLEKELGRIISQDAQLSSPEVIRQQAERMSSIILNDMLLMARTKELFSVDLIKIDEMLSETLAHFRLLLERSSASQISQLRQLFEDLFTRVVELSSSLFDSSQRNCWLELNSPDLRRQLEIRLLNHVKEAGLLVSGALPKVDLNELPVVNRANVRAGLSMLTQPYNLEDSSSSSSSSSTQETGEFNLPSQQQQNHAKLFNYFNPFYSSQQSSVSNQASDVANLNNYVNDEFKMNTLLAKELLFRGASRFLVINVRKPDYSMIRQHLESLSDLGNSINSGVVSGVGDTTQQQISNGWTTNQVFGLFALDYSARKVIKNEDSIGGTSSRTRESSSGYLNNLNDSNQQQGMRWFELLAKWPISFHFKQQLPVIANNLQRPARECNLLSSLSLPSSSSSDDNPITSLANNRCQTIKFNATDHICACDSFGFVSLTTITSLNNNNLVPGFFPPATTANDIQWPAPILVTDNSLQDYPAEGLRRNPSIFDPSGYPSSIQQQAGGSRQHHSTTETLGRTLLLIISCLIIFIAFAALIINAFLRASAHQSRLNKKGGFPVLGSNPIIQPGGPTTGPLPAEHTLIGGADTIVTSNSSNSSHNTIGATTHSTSIIGLNSHQSACYKTTIGHAQQLYASHLPPMLDRRGSSGWFRGSRGWFSWSQPKWLRNIISRSSRGLSVEQANKNDQLQHHHVIGSTLGNQASSLAGYKGASQYQNGYTTSLHHPLSHHLHLGNQSNSSANSSSRLPLTGPAGHASSSTSSYVSSSAYYEEIGPGNLTKLNANQLANSRTMTIVEPFIKQRQASDQQQLISTTISGNGVASLVNQQQQQQPIWQQNTSLSYSVMNPQANNANCYSGETTPPINNNNNPAANQNQTPRHYLFASSTAVNAYKSSMGQPMHYNHHHQHDNQHQQHPLPEVLAGRPFMGSN